MSVKMKGNSRLRISLALLLLIFLNLLLYTKCTEDLISIHSDPDFKGISAKINIAQCTNLPNEMVENVESVNTQAHCVRLFDEENCAGNSAILSPYSPAHNNLAFMDFSNLAKSVGSCRETCFMEAPGNRFDDPLDITLFKNRNFQGDSRKIKVQGCTPVPAEFGPNDISAIKASGQCIQFYDNSNCITKLYFTMEMGSHFHKEIDEWRSQKTLAISRCKFWCPPSINEGEVMLFRDRNFEGKILMKQVNNVTCVNVVDNSDGVVFSVSVGDQTCVALFNQHGCTGESTRVTSSLSDLSVVKFHGHIWSMSSCTTSGMMTSPKPTIPNHTTTTTTTTTTKKPEINMSNITTKNQYFEAKEPVNNSINFSPQTIVLIVLAPITLVLLATGVGFVIKQKCCGKDGSGVVVVEAHKLEDKEVDNFLSGFEMTAVHTSSGCGDVENSNDYSVQLLAQQQPYDDAYEVARNKIKFDSRAPLGMGEFGVVYQGTVELERQAIFSSSSTSGANSTIENCPVAIKTVNPTADAHGLRSLLKEVKVMLHTGSHPNIARMLGCCTENLRQGEILVLMEFCSNGSLESYLLRNRSSFVNLVTKGKLEPRDDSTQTRISYKNIQNVVGADSSNSFDIFQLLEWCKGVACGMEFLSNAKIVHSDLAARNVLLDDGLLAKISDFGLSRQLYNYSQYMKKNLEPMPFRWMALESLTQLEFSTKSDVWSYGVLCWEIFTLGNKPYPNLNWNEAFISNLEDGMRLSKPKYSTFDMYNLMIGCWEGEPSLRPSFPDIRQEIQQIFLLSNA